MITIGIDLGTTNSAAAYHDGLKIDFIPLPDGGQILPSVVSIGSDGSVVVGASALDQVTKEPDFTFQNFKRLMGVPYNDEIDMGPQVTEGPNGMAAYRGPDRVYLPEELSAFVLEELRSAASGWFSDEVKGCVITVPADFEQAQRDATREAALLAGFDQIDLLSEPEAAAIACGLDLEKFHRILVFDLGGGTFDVAVMETAQGYAHTLHKNGNRRLGGADFDAAIAEEVVRVYREEKDFDLKSLPFTLISVQKASEKAKRTLTRQPAAKIDHSFAAYRPDGEAVHVKHSIDRDRFEDIVEDLVSQTLEKTAQTLKDADLQVEQIDHIVLVGGMTRVPVVRDAVKSFFNGREPMRLVHPDLIVTQGAAMQAAINENRIMGGTGSGVLAMSIGIEVPGGHFLPVLPKGTKFGESEGFGITSAVEGQGTLSINVFRGDSTRVTSNVLLAQHEVALPADTQAGQPESRVEFELSHTGGLTVTVDDTIILETEA